MITVPSVDNETAAAHLQGMFGSFVLHILMSLWLALCVTPPMERSFVVFAFLLVVFIVYRSANR